MLGLTYKRVKMKNNNKNYKFAQIHTHNSCRGSIHSKKAFNIQVLQQDKRRDDQSFLLIFVFRGISL